MKKKLKASGSSAVLLYILTVLLGISWLSNVYLDKLSDDPINGKDVMLAYHRKWLRGEADGVRADLSYAFLSYANLSSANLSDAELSKANLSRANLPYADLSYASLYKVIGAHCK